MVVAELSLIPLAGSDMRPFVDAAVEAISRSGLKYEVEPLGTSMEGEFDDVLKAAKAARDAVMRLGCDRLITEIRIDERRSSDETMNREVAAYRAVTAGR